MRWSLIALCAGLTVLSAACHRAASPSADWLLLDTLDQVCDEARSSSASPRELPGVYVEVDDAIGDVYTAFRTVVVVDRDRRGRIQRVERWLFDYSPTGWATGDTAGVAWRVRRRPNGDAIFSVDREHAVLGLDNTAVAVRMSVEGCVARGEVAP